MRNIFSFLLAFVLIGTIVSGCKEKPVTTPGDLEAPKIFLSGPEVVPLGSFVQMQSSDSFFVDVRFEDDFELRDYDISIRFMPSLNYLKTTNDPWNEHWFGNLDGKLGGANFLTHIVYNPTAGPYEFRVRCTDESGKQTEVLTYIFMTNQGDSIKPTVTLNQPDTTDVDTFTIGQQIPVIGLANDPGGLIEDIYIRVRDGFTNELMMDSEIRIDTIFLNPVVIDTFVTIPAGTVPGDYNLEVYANDPTFNVGSITAKVYIKPN
ncbi:MAG TPA: hypothetical protein ENJ82_17480 [Bacteroidetes bacterium]|nr:hypothetical protein [Bacteroidota bacterium]